MKKYYISGAALYLLLLLELPFPFASMAFGATVLIAYLLREQYLKFLKIQHYANCYDNIYVVSDHPEGDPFYMPEFGNILVTAPYKKVLKQVEQEKAWLIKSGNNFYNDPGLTEKQRLKVIAIIYQDGEFINETWGEFYSRVYTTIKADRKERHKLLKSADVDWYHKYGNFQVL